jgi:hypothetical protein
MDSSTSFSWPKQLLVTLPPQQASIRTIITAATRKISKEFPNPKILSFKVGASGAAAT